MLHCPHLPVCSMAHAVLVQANLSSSWIEVAGTKTSILLESFSFDGAAIYSREPSYKHSCHPSRPHPINRYDYSHSSIFIKPIPNSPSSGLLPVKAFQHSSLSNLYSFNPSSTSMLPDLPETHTHRVLCFQFSRGPRHPQPHFHVPPISCERSVASNFWPTACNMSVFVSGFPFSVHISTS